MATRKNITPGFAIEINDDTDLGLAMLIAESEEGQYDPVAVVVNINEAREIAETIWVSARANDDFVFHGMEKVVSSNLTRSTTTFNRYSTRPFSPEKKLPRGDQIAHPMPHFSTTTKAGFGRVLNVRRAWLTAS